MSSILPLNISKPETKKCLRKISSTKLFYIFIYILYILLYIHLLSFIINNFIKPYTKTLHCDHIN